MSERSLMDQLEFAVEALLHDQPVMVAPDPELGALLDVAGDLRYLPRPRFLAELKSDLDEEGEAMTTTMTKPVREGFRTVTPYITVEKALEMSEFLKNAFGAEETYRSPTVGSAGGYHLELRIGDTTLMVGGGGQYKGPSYPTSLHMYVPDVDAAFDRAVAAGATPIMRPTDQDYGDRDSALKDPFGNEWYLATHKGESYVRPGLGTVTPYLHPTGADELIRFLQSAFGADPYEVDVVPEEGNRIVHAKVRIADSVIELGEAHGPWQNMPTHFLFYVDDADAWYQRAVKGEAIAVSPPADLPYGRCGTVRDGWGNEYYITTPPQSK
jgi:PhnB protein